MSADLADLPIEEAAHEVLEVEHSAVVDQEFEIALGESFNDPGMVRAFSRVSHTLPIRNYRLRDVTLDGSLMLLLRGRRRIPQTRYMVSESEYDHTLTKPLPLIHHDPGQHHVIGTTRAWQNYYHWLIQSVPAIDWSLRNANHRKLTLVMPPLRRWHEEMLTLLGYQDVPRLILDRSCTYRFPSAEFSDFLGEQMPASVSRAATRTFDPIRERMAATPRVESAMDFLRRTRTAYPDEIVLPVRGAASPSTPETRAEPEAAGLWSRIARVVRPRRRHSESV